MLCFNINPTLTSDHTFWTYLPRACEDLFYDCAYSKTEKGHCTFFQRKPWKNFGSVQTTSRVCKIALSATPFSLLVAYQTRRNVYIGQTGRCMYERRREHKLLIPDKGLICLWLQWKSIDYLSETMTAITGKNEIRRCSLDQLAPKLAEVFFFFFRRKMIGPAYLAQIVQELMQVYDA